MSHKSREEFRLELDNASAIIDKNPEIQKLPIDMIWDALNNKNVEIKENRIAISAILYIKHLHDFSYDNLAVFLSQNTISEHVSRYVMFLLQDRYNISCIKLLLSAVKHQIVNQIIPYICHNMIYDPYCDMNLIQDFFSVIQYIPQTKQYYIFSGFSEIILVSSLENETFKFLVDNKPQTAESFLPYLLSDIFNKKPENGNQCLSTLIHSSDAEFWSNSIAVGINESLKNDNEIFETYYSVIDALAQNENAWKSLIPCYVAYILSDHSHSSFVYEAVVIKVKSISESDLEIKKIFIQTLIAEHKESNLLESTVLSICERPFRKNKEDLEILEYYFLQKAKIANNDSIINPLLSVFLANGFDLNNYFDYFNIFEDSWAELKKNQKAVWKLFLSTFLDSNEKNLAFSLGLFENVLNLSLHQKNDLNHLNINESLCCLILKVMNVLSSNSAQLCQLSFFLINCLSENKNKYIETIIDEIYYSYPYTLYEMAQSVHQHTSLPVIKHLADLIKSKYIERQENQEKYLSVPDLLPSEERSEIYKKCILEQNRKILKQAKEKSIFAQLFPSRVMLYGKKIGTLRTVQPGQYEYQPIDYIPFERSIEINWLYAFSPSEWLAHKMKILEERKDYLAINHQRLSENTKREE